MSNEYLYEAPDERLGWGPNGPERTKLAPDMGPLERSASNFMTRQGLGGTTPNPGSFKVTAQPAGPVRAPTPDELMARAEAALAATYAQRDAQMENPSLGEQDAAGKRIPDWLAKYMKDGDNQR